MITTEHLVKTKCQSLLDLAEKRTQGRWVAGATIIGNGIDKTVCYGPEGCDLHIDQEWSADKAYIAACAGTAEAGWESTISAIELLEEVQDRIHVSTFKNMADAIIAAWPEELL